jgi:uncharacterized protein YbjT (DUF2867 family)
VIVCVLGGSGFVGSELVRRLVYAGHWVRVPTRSLAAVERLRVLDTAELRLANVHEPRILSQLFGGCDAVINLVGILNPAGSATFETAHTALALKVMQAARAAGVRRVLHMSALGADENAPSNYLRSKASAETQLRLNPHPEAFHPEVSIFRPSVIFGPNDSLTNRFAGLLRLSGGFLPLARVHARFAPVSVYDVVEAFLRVLETPAGGGGHAYELCGPEVMTLGDIVRLTAKVAQLPCHIVPLSDALGRVQAAVLGLLPGTPFSLDNFRSLTRDSVCRQNGLRELGITARPMLADLPAYLAPHGASA